MNLTQHIYNKTVLYLQTVSRDERKKIGQFFTPPLIAEYMGSLSNIYKHTVHILDPGAGSGILSAAIIDKLIKDDIKNIYLDVYENNSDIIPLLNDNLCLIQKSLKEINVFFKYQIFSSNFIEVNQFIWNERSEDRKYDIVICNPPYKKIGKTDLESIIMCDIVYGQPNLYFLFMAMGGHLLKENGELIYIVPRSFSSGLYFTKFRKYFLDTMRITNLHLFTSRAIMSGKNDNILQETIILRAIKAREVPNLIEITSSSTDDCTNVISKNFVDYHTCVSDCNNAFLFFPTNQHDIDTVNFVKCWPSTLSSLGYRIKTGVVVDFRETKWLRCHESEDIVPLLWAYNFCNYRIKFPLHVQGKPQYLLNVNETKRLLMDKSNYLLLKRFTSKEEARRLQCSLLFEEDFSDYGSISTENHLNYITKIFGKITKEELYGLFVVFNSSYLDDYFRVLNGSTQVNANEINSIPMPSNETIIKMGNQIMQSDDLSEANCNSILERQFLVTTKKDQRRIYYGQTRRIKRDSIGNRNA